MITNGVILHIRLYVFQNVTKIAKHSALVSQ